MLPATMPVISVAAPRTEFDLERIDLDCFRLPSGVPETAAPPPPFEPKLLSRVGVTGIRVELAREGWRECDGLLYLAMNVSRGCFIANLRLLIRPPLSRFIKASSSRTSVKAAGRCWKRSSLSETVNSGTLECALRLSDSGITFSRSASGMRRMTMPMGIDKKPRRMAVPHIIPVCPPDAILKALPPTKTMSTCPPHIMALIPMKNQFLNKPSKMLNWLSRRRLLCLISILIDPQDLEHGMKNLTYFHWLNICIHTNVLNTSV